MQIIPAIDLYEGHCVRLTEGDFSRKQEYSADPAATARRFADAGFQWLHVVDLEGAKRGQVAHWALLEQILMVAKLDIQVGGGIRTDEDVARLLQLGASRVIIGSIALHSPETLARWADRFGPQNFCVAVDVKDGAVASHAWQTRGSLELNKVILNIRRFGIETFLCTDIMRDGTLRGPNVPLYRGLAEQFPTVRWLASGGITTQADLLQLRKTKVAGAVIGKALYEGKFNVDELAKMVL